MSELSLLKEELFGNDSAISDIKFILARARTAQLTRLRRSIRAAIADVAAGGGKDIDLSY